MHLRKDLDADPVDWRECQDPLEASDEARPAEQRGVLTRYGLQKSVQRLLSALRTDLDSFTEVEAFALMTSGYRQARQELARLPGSGAPSPSRPWRFLQIEPVLGPGPGYDDLQKQLRIGSYNAGKVWLLWMPLTVLGIAVLLIAALALLWLWWINQDRTVLTVYSLGVFLGGLALAVIAPHLVRLIRYKKTFRDVGLRSLFAAGMALVFKVHLMLLDPLFLRLGRVARLIEQRDKGRVNAKQA